MPYGMPKKMGGDNMKNDKWMEGCVAKVSKQKGKDGKPMGKDRAIAVCKATFMKTHGDTSKAEFILDQMFFGKLGTDNKG